MFVIKKIISAFIMPLSIGILLLLLALYLLSRKKIKAAKITIALSFIWIFIMGYQPFANLLLAPLESKYSKLESIPYDVKYILLLGGDPEGRTYEVLRLYNMSRGLKIITSGYEGSFDVAEAIESRDFLIELGISKNDIIIQADPKDTKEEAIATKQIVGKEKFILVTDAIHMDRAIKLFNKQGLYPIPAPTNFLEKKSIYLNLPSGNDLEHTERAIHEYLGTLWYIIKGDI